MLYRMTRLLLVTIIFCAIVNPVYALPTPVTNTYNFTVYDFVSSYGSPVPEDPITGSLTVTLFPGVSEFDFAADEVSFAIDGWPYFTFDTSVDYDHLTDEIIFGGNIDAGDTNNIVQFSENDFILIFSDALSSPQLSLFTYTTFYSFDYFSTTSGTVELVTEPAALFLIIAGIPILIRRRV